MSEYKKQITGGALVGVLIAVSLAYGASIYFPSEQIHTAYPSTTNWKTSATPSTYTNVITTTVPTEAPSSETKTGTTSRTDLTTTVTEVLTEREGLEVAVYALNQTDIVVNIRSSRDITITDILLNGNTLTSLKGEVFDINLPIKVTPRSPQTIKLKFSTPLPSNTTYNVLIKTSSDYYTTVVIP
ncbi:MAG: hypothetical protein QXJ17_02325 [Nitrososphaeria archaeon]